MTAGKKTTRRKSREGVAPVVTGRPDYFLEWLRCDGQRLAQVKARSVTPKATKNYRDHVLDVVEEALGKSGKAFRGDVVCQGFVEYSEGTFPALELIKLHEVLGETLKVCFTSCRSPVRLILCLQGTNLVEVCLLPEDSEGQFEVVVLGATEELRPPLNKLQNRPTVADMPLREEQGQKRTQPEGGNEGLDQLTGPAVDGLIEETKAKLVELSKPMVAPLQRLLKKLEGLSDKKYDADWNKELCSKVNKLASDRQLCLLYEGQVAHLVYHLRDGFIVRNIDKDTLKSSHAFPQLQAGLRPLVAEASAAD